MDQNIVLMQHMSAFLRSTQVELYLALYDSLLGQEWLFQLMFL